MSRVCVGSGDSGGRLAVADRSFSRASQLLRAIASLDGAGLPAKRPALPFA
jgi:hypothetical protein